MLMMVVCVTMLVTCCTDDATDASVPAAGKCATDEEGDMRGVVDLRGRIASMAAEDEDEERDERVMALLAVWETLPKGGRGANVV